MARIKFTKTAIEALDAGKFLWDSEVPGLGVRAVARKDGVTRVYLVRYRMGPGCKQQYYRLGKHGAIAVDQARTLAKKALGLIADGKDPKVFEKGPAGPEGALTIAQLAATYLAEHAKREKKQSSWVKDQQNLDNHILPAIGRRPVADVKRADITALHNDLRDAGKPGIARKVVTLLSAMFNFGIRRDPPLVTDNPARLIKKAPPKEVARRVTDDDFSKIFAALETTREDQRFVVVVKLLAFTGARTSELLGLRWRNVKWAQQRVVLEDSKTGAGELFAGAAGIAALRDIAPENPDPDGWVFPSLKDPKIALSYNTYSRFWVRLKAEAGVRGRFRNHDFRHEAASRAAERGESMTAIQGLLRHTSPSMANHYVRTAARSAPARSAAERNQASILAAVHQPASQGRRQ